MSGMFSRSPLLSTVAPVAIAVTVVVTVTMGFADANGDARFAAIHADASSAADPITMPGVAMPATGTGPARAMAAVDQLKAVVHFRVCLRCRKWRGMCGAHTHCQRSREQR
jgi:negative regulator of sigma E activity